MSRPFAIVTGASSGIGFELAHELASRGYDLAICSAGERLQRATERLKARGSEVLAVQADLATREGVKQFWDAAVSLGREIDIACINAGVGVGGLFTETELDAELNMVNLNCSGTVQLAKYVVQHMKTRNRGGCSPTRKRFIECGMTWRTRRRGKSKLSASRGLARPLRIGR